MLRFIVPLMLLGVATTRISAQDVPVTAGDLLRSCEVSPAKPACMWYVKGFLDGMMLDSAKLPVRTLCLPDGFDFDQMRRVIVKSLADHPEKLHLSVAITVQDALRDAFPCKK